MVAILALALGMLGSQAEDRISRFLEAEQLAREGHSREALSMFQRIAEADPGEVEARLWVARLWRRLGRTDRAEAEFRAVLAQTPDHVEALSGLGSVLSTRGALAEASSVIDRAESLAPQNADVLAARARCLRMSGRPAAAEAYLEEASSISPDDSDIRQALEQVRRLNRNRLEVAFQNEALSRGSTARVADVTADVRAADRVRVDGRLQASWRDSSDDVRAGGGLEWLARPALTVRASALFGPGAELIPRLDLSGGVEHVRGRVEVSGGVRRLEFATAAVWIVAPGGTFWIDDRAALTVRYYNSSTRFRERPAEFNHSLLTRIRYGLRPRLWVDAGYSRGYESLDTLSSERLASLRADTWSTGCVYHLRGLESLAAGLDYQRRSDGRSIVRVTAAVVHRY